VITGVGQGVSTISYSITNPNGSLIKVTRDVTVNALPVVEEITGNMQICIGATTLYSNKTSGGVWKSSNTSIATINESGLITGKDLGVATISYIVTNNNGCVVAVSKDIKTVNELPTIASISGPQQLCVGSNTTFSNTTLGGLWSSSNASIAKINAAGLITAISPGISIINYAVANESGCIKSVSQQIIVNPNPSVPKIYRDKDNFLLSSSLVNVWYKDGVALTDSSQRIKYNPNDQFTIRAVSNGCVSDLSAPYYLVTDIINLSKDEFISISPNPFIGFINVNFKLNYNQKLNIDIIDISSGHIVYTVRDVYSGTKLKIDNLSSGVYLVRALTNDSKHFYQFKIVKL
jgi:hypothetical protein